MTTQEILKLCGKGEQTPVQMKERVTDAYELGEEMVCYANERGGGVIIIGVNDKTGKVNALSRTEVQEQTGLLSQIATDKDWSDELHKIIRDNLVRNLNRKYTFWRIYPKESPVPFVWYHFHEIIGKAYRTQLLADDIILAFENTDEGLAHKTALERSIKNDIIGEMTKFTLEP